MSPTLPPAVAVLRDWLLQHRPVWVAPSHDYDALQLWALGEGLGAPWGLLEQVWAEVAWAAWTSSGQRYYVQHLPQTNAATLSAWRAW